MLVQLADWCYRQRRLVVVLWIAALAAAFALASSFGGETKQDYLQPGSESQAASETLQAKFPQRAGDTLQVVLHSEDGFSSAAVRTRADRIFAGVAADPHVMGVASPFSDGGASQISQDGKTAYALVALDKTADQYIPAQAKALIEPVLAAGDDTLRVEAGGPVAALSQTAPVGGEGVGLIAAALILLFAFGSAVAMGLPLLTAVFGLGMAIALGELLRRVVDVPDWATATAAMVGIGVGIDYALLIVTRYRSSLAEGRDPRQATLTAIATAGRAVVFAGLTVVVAMLGILLVGQPALAGFAFTASLFVLVTLTASLTLLPAMLGFAGRSIERLHVPFVSKNQHAYDTTRWYRWSRFIQHRPWITAIGGLAVLMALAAPFLGMRFGFPDAQNDPKSYTTHQAYDLLADGFGPGFSAPLVLAVRGASGTELLTASDTLGKELAEVSGVALVSPTVVNDAGDTAVLTLVPASSPQDEATEALVETLRDTAIPDATSDTGVTVAVGGMVASNLDITRGVADRLPLFFGGVLLVSFVLLMMVFRSVVVPLKAVVMNLLASAAAFGVLTLAASGGPLGDLVGIPEATPIPILLPVGIFAILFGLSMDYEVFLLSRIKEEYDRSGDNALAVADGLAKSARVITAGAAVMITVFLSFVLGQDVFGKMFGIGLAAAVFIDATIVRMVLVPATMELLGDRNWWLPAWLDRLLPNIHVEGHEVTDDETAAPEPSSPRPRFRRAPALALTRRERHDQHPAAHVPTGAQPMITVTGVTRKYGNFTAVDDVSFTAQAGRVTGFLGPNGAGKSTTMRIMVGLTRATSGTVTISGRHYVDLPNPGLEVGVLLDASAQHAGRTGREILTIAQQYMGLPRQRVEEMVEVVSLTPSEASRRVGNYSLGMRQRLGIATALIGDPKVLILDEPANGLDPAGIRWMRDLLRGYADRGGTVLLSSHLLHEIEVIADDIVMIGNGKIVSQGTKTELLHAAGTVVRATDLDILQRALGELGIATTLSEDGALHTDVDPTLVGKVALQAGVSLTELRTADAGLEDMFLELTATSQREGTTT